MTDSTRTHDGGFKAKIAKLTEDVARLERQVKDERSRSRSLSQRERSNANLAAGYKHERDTLAAKFEELRWMHQPSGEKPCGCAPVGMPCPTLRVLIQAERDHVIDLVRSARAERDALAAQIERVRAVAEQCPVYWAAAIVRALDGDGGE